jgi:short-chain fatty acids transporter
VFVLWLQGTLALDLNMVIPIFPIGGIALHGTPVANMLQPCWALPAVAMAGIGIQRVMGYTVVTFAVTGVIYALALLLLI